MRNYKQLNGTITLQVDYIGLTKLDTFENPTSIRFLAMTIPALWTTDYTITRNLTETPDASTIISTYDKSTHNFVAESTSAGIFVFLNQTATTPTWGTGWQTIQTNIVSGYVDNKKVILCGTKLIDQENINSVAEIIYNHCQKQAP